jgi:hypothetical protein
MEKKTKIKVAIVLAIIIIAIVLILMILFVKENSTNQNDIPTKVPTTSLTDNSLTDDLENNNGNDLVEELNLDDVESLAISSNTLVKIKSDASCEIVKEFGSDLEKNYIAYTYDDSKAYVVYSYETEFGYVNRVYSIDLLQSDYPEELVYESETPDYADDLIVSDGKIYYTTISKTIVEYSINEEALKTISPDEALVTAGTLAIDKDKNILYYIAASNGASAIYSVNLGTSKTTTILNGFEKGYNLSLCNEKYLICNLDDENYLFNIDTGYFWDIGLTVNSDESNRSTDKITTYKSDYVMYTNEEKIELRDFEGNLLNESLYAVTEDNIITGISMITENKLQIKVHSNVNAFVDDNKSYIVDFETSTIVAGSNIYDSIINIK